MLLPLARFTPRTRFLAARHVAQRFGALVKPLLAKNDCSLARKVKLLPQSTHFNFLSVKPKVRHPFFMTALNTGHPVF